MISSTLNVMIAVGFFIILGIMIYDPGFNLPRLSQIGIVLICACHFMGEAHRR